MFRLIFYSVILLLFFGGGVFWGMMVHPKIAVIEKASMEYKTEYDEVVEAEQVSIEDLEENRIIIGQSSSEERVNPSKDQPIFSLATFLEKVITFFYELIITVLFFIAEFIFAL